jgi:hypothetical protein
MKHIKTFDALLYRDKIKQLIPEMYIIFEYSVFNFKESRYYNYLILGKISSVPYKEESNTFIDIKVTNYITYDKDEFFYKNSYNIDFISDIKYTSSSFKTTKVEYEKFKDDFKIKENSIKYNL